MNMSKVVLHIGLPKTATTTLQKHVFFKLHKQNKINYLGKKPEAEDENKYYPLEMVINSLLNNDESEFQSKHKEYKVLVKKMIDKRKINVLSDEQLSLAICYDFEVVCKRLKILFEEYDVSILCFIRNQVDMMYSFYVEMYSACYYRDEDKNTIEKFYDKVVNGNDSDLTQFNYAGISEVLWKIFGKKQVNIFLFESFVGRNKKVFKRIADLLGVIESDVSDVFLSNIENKKKEIRGNYLSKDITVYKIVSRVAMKLKKKPSMYVLIGFVEKILAVSAFKKITKQWLMGLTIENGVEHRRFNVDEIECIRNKFKEGNLRLLEGIDISCSDEENYYYL